MTILGLSLTAACLQAQAPHQPEGFRPGEVMLDTAGQPINAHGGGMLRYRGLYYFFGGVMKGKTVDQHVPLPGVSCYSSRDLYHWKNEGVVLPPVINGSDLVPPRFIERPKVVYNPRTRKFVMWMHVDTLDYQYARAGVAVSDSPTGPYHYLGSVRPNHSMSRDMTLFQAHNGKAYLIFASEDNQTMHIAQLTDDYLKPDGVMIRIFVGQYREAPAAFEYRSQYFLINSKCSGWAPNAALYAVAPSMLGPWKVMENPTVGSGSDQTFDSQSTYVLPVAGRHGAFIFMADRWNPDDLEDSRYIWLPISIHGDKLEIRWHDQWDLSIFK
jgi:hypothetical protein